jgi:hypothetical protein
MTTYKYGAVIRRECTCTYFVHIWGPRRRMHAPRKNKPSVTVRLLMIRCMYQVLLASYPQIRWPLRACFLLVCANTLFLKQCVRVCVCVCHVEAFTSKRDFRVPIMPPLPLHSSLLLSHITDMISSSPHIFAASIIYVIYM